jgi:putative acetyltransferase
MTRQIKSNLIISVNDLSGQEIAALLSRHLDFCRFHSPPGSVHALDIDGLRRDGIIFWSASLNGKLVGCIALKEIDPSHGEIKSMHILSEARGAGVGRALVEHLLAEGEARRYERLSLETGTMEGFKPARRLYASYGFERCPPFANYFEDPNSVCMTKRL